MAALGAAVCCAGPLILLLLGISGAWISHLTVVEPARPFLITIALILFLKAGWSLYRPKARCEAGNSCSLPSRRRLYQIIFWLLAAVASLLITSPWLLVWFY